MTEQVTPIVPPAGEEGHSEERHDPDVDRFEDEGGPVVPEASEIPEAPEPQAGSSATAPEQPQAEAPAAPDSDVESFENEGGYTPPEQ